MKLPTVAACVMPIVSSRIFARPKSSTFMRTRPCEAAMKRLAGLTSRCTTPCRWAWSSAIAPGSKTATSSSSERPRSFCSRLDLRSIARELPSSHSSTMYGTSAPVGATVVPAMMQRTMSRLP